MPGLYIIKLGGSVITEKEGNRFEVKEEEIARIATEVKKAMDEEGFQLIVVHGAGPFGHTNVKEFGIENGVYSERHKQGLEKTIKDCNYLDSVVVEKLREQGIEAVAFNPWELIEARERKIVRFEITGIEKALGEGKVPVLYGQMVKDEAVNASPLSGDSIIAFLTKKLKPEKVLLGTDVAGIFTADPKRVKEAKRIELVDENNFEEILEKVEESAAVDVTGGMKGKLMKLREQLKGTTALIFDAKEKGNFYRALKGEKVEGTTIRL